METVQPNSIEFGPERFDKEAGTVTATTTQLQASTITSEPSQQSQQQNQKQEAETRAQKDRKLLSLLRSKEERAVREHWEWALDRADITARGIGEPGYRKRQLLFLRRQLDAIVRTSMRCYSNRFAPPRYWPMAVIYCAQPCTDAHC